MQKLCFKYTVKTKPKDTQKYDESQSINDHMFPLTESVVKKIHVHIQV